MQTRRQREIGLFANSPDNVMPPYSKLKLPLYLSLSKVVLFHSAPAATANCGPFCPEASRRGSRRIRNSQSFNDFLNSLT